MLAFVLGAFLAGVGGGLQASLIGSIDPAMYKLPLNVPNPFDGGLRGYGLDNGGTVIAATIVTALMEIFALCGIPTDVGCHPFTGYSRHAHGSVFVVADSGHLVLPPWSHGRQGIFLGFVAPTRQTKQGVTPINESTSTA